MKPETGAVTVGARFQRFADIIHRLRSPGGCPWDLEQTHHSLRPMTLEEAYEVVHAIDDEDWEGLKGELGDVLLHVVFHADVAMRAARFDIGDVVDAASDKMVRRHPHVFGDTFAATAERVIRNWEELKRRERQEKGDPPVVSLLDTVSSRMPALMEAAQISEKAARANFDWASADDVIPKVEEELREVARAARESAKASATGTAVAKDSPARQALELEVGDLLFAAVNLARKLGIDPESALRRANGKFRRRFRAVEDGLRDRGRSPASSSIEEMEELWSAAKARERAGILPAP
jgi:MazG family protein